MTLNWNGGLHGIVELATCSDVIIIVDILSFSTCVDIATNQGAIIYPYRWKDETANEYARSLNAELADYHRKHSDGFSLSPNSLIDIKPGTKLVLPSPNGSTLSLSTENIPTVCASLRNAKAVAKFAMSLGSRISIIPGGEQWPDNSIRFASEDLIGAGAIISNLQGHLSIESTIALAAFQSVKSDLLTNIKNCGSGKELMERGFEKDIDLAFDFNSSNNVPVLFQHAYRGQMGRPL